MWLLTVNWTTLHYTVRDAGERKCLWRSSVGMCLWCVLDSTAVLTRFQCVILAWPEMWWVFSLCSNPQSTFSPTLSSLRSRHFQFNYLSPSVKFCAVENLERGQRDRVYFRASDSKNTEREKEVYSVREWLNTYIYNMLWILQDSNINEKDTNIFIIVTNSKLECIFVQLLLHCSYNIGLIMLNFS